MNKQGRSRVSQTPIAAAVPQTLVDIASILLEGRSPYRHMPFGIASTPDLVEQTDMVEHK